MALDKTGLKNALLDLFFYESTQETDPAASRERIAEGMADAIEDYVKSGDGHYQPGTLTSPSGTVTSVGPGTIVKLQ